MHIRLQAPPFLLAVSVARSVSCRIVQEYGRYANVDGTPARPCDRLRLDQLAPVARDKRLQRPALPPDVDPTVRISVLIKGEGKFIRAVESSAAETAPGLELEPHYAWPWMALGHGLISKGPAVSAGSRTCWGFPVRAVTPSRTRRKDESAGGVSHDSTAHLKNRHKDPRLS